MRVKPVKRQKRDMDKCLFCAGCVTNCAAYRGLGWESYSPRGKVRLLQSGLQGWFADPEGLVDRVYTCTLCRSCDRACDSDLEPSEIVLSARADAVKGGTAPPAITNLIETIDETGNPQHQNPAARDKWIEENADRLDPDSSTLLFAGCYAAYSARPALAKVLAGLNRVGITPAAMPGEQCCGLVSYQTGAVAQAERLAKQNIAWMRAHDIKRVIFLCPSCASFIAEIYPKVDKLFSVEIVPYFAIFAEHPELVPVRDLAGARVTYHDPCHLARYLEVMDIPRQLVARTGAELVEMAHNREDVACCGGGGGLLAYSTDRALLIAEARVRDALETGAPTIVTPCFTCRDTLEGGVFRVDAAMDADLEVWNLLDLFAVEP